MKSIVRGLTLAGAVAFATGAMADGMPSRGSVKDAPAPFSWTGFYGGLNAGAHWLNADPYSAIAADAATAGGAGLVGGTCAAGACTTTLPGAKATGAIGGIQLGYNLQFQSIVVGIEADIQGSTAQAHGTTFRRNAGIGFSDWTGTGNTNVEWVGTVRARLGALISPTLLAYVTGGWAYGGVQRQYGFQFLPGGAGTAAATFGRSRDIESGWTAGGGLEWAVTNKVTIGAEYLYFQLDGGDRFAVSAGPLGNGTCAATNCNLLARGGESDNHIARLKVNYKF